jgi:hypothetical protein
MVTSVDGSFTNVNLIYRWFDISDIDQRIGYVSELKTDVKSNIVDSINDLYDRVTAIIGGGELAGSPFDSYADFTAVYSTPQEGHFAYVTFIDTDTWPGDWTNVQVD